MSIAGGSQDLSTIARSTGGSSAVDDMLGDLSSHTRRAYASDLAQVAEWCADRGIGGVEELQVGHLVAYLVELRRSGRKSSTVRRRLTAIRKLVVRRI